MRRSARVGDVVVHKETRAAANVVERWDRNFTLGWLDGERALRLSYVSGEELKKSFEILGYEAAKLSKKWIKHGN